MFVLYVHGPKESLLGAGLELGVSLLRVMLDLLNQEIISMGKKFQGKTFSFGKLMVILKKETFIFFK